MKIVHTTKTDDTWHDVSRRYQKRVESRKKAKRMLMRIGGIAIILVMLQISLFAAGGEYDLMHFFAAGVLVLGAGTAVAAMILGALMFAASFKND